MVKSKIRDVEAIPPNQDIVLLFPEKQLIEGFDVLYRNDTLVKVSPEDFGDTVFEWKTVSDYNILEGTTLYLVLRSQGWCQ